MRRRYTRRVRFLSLLVTPVESENAREKTGNDDDDKHQQLGISHCSRPALSMSSNR
jgi:hypothetical protein